MLSSVTNFFKRTDPDWQRFRQIAERKTLLTPDYHELQQFERIKVFVYNECQKDQPQHAKLGPAVLYGGFGYTEDNSYVLYKKLLGKETFPFAMEIQDNQRHGMSSFLGDPGQVMGELWSIRPADVVELDYYMLNTVYYDRKRVKLLITRSKTDVYKTEAFMYIGRPEFWNDQIFSNEGRDLFARSSRLFATKENSDTLGAHYVFDYNVEVGKK